MIKTTRFKMWVPKRKKPPVDREELRLYWKGLIDLGVRELIVDNFAGGGGASTGIEEATGYSVDYAINHDPDAIAMHKVNHPNTIHFCESVWDVNPRELAKGRPVGLVWLSPDCKHFSKAKGGKPVEKSIRGLAWIAVRWAATVRPRVIMLENVEEFKTWGPVIQDSDGNYYPDPKRKGKTFKSFIKALEAEGYDVEWKEMRACDYGAPTIRKRFFMIARCDGQAIVWPEPTHADPKKMKIKIAAGELKPWRTAASIIDWSIPCPSIFEREKELAPNTQRRIVRGIDKFIIKVAETGGIPFLAPYIVKVNHSGDEFRGQRIDEPLQTMTSKNGYGVVTPFIARIGQTGFSKDGTPHSLHDPLTTVVTKAEHLLVSPTLIQTGYGERKGQESRALDLDKPLGTVVAGGVKHALVATSLVKHYGGNYNGPGNDIEDPLSTVTTVDHNALVSALMLQYNTETTENGMRGQSLNEPINTIPTANRYGLVTAHMARHFGESIGHAMDEPNGTITADGGGHSALITSNLIKLRGDNIGQMLDEPLRTITSGGNHHAEVRALLIEYYSASVGQSLDDPLHTISTHDRFGLVMIFGTLYQIIDIGMRMLEPHELYAAQGFPTSYIIDGYLLNNGKKVPKSKQVARCGNSVSPPMSKAMVKSNLSHLCAGNGKVLAFHRYDPAMKSNGQLELSM
jgi:DNA (cytosine-5)-methyltransferase 1